MSPYSGRISKETDYHDEGDGEVGHPPYVSTPTPSIVKMVMRGDEVFLEVEMAPEKLAELEKLGAELNIRLVPESAG